MACMQSHRSRAIIRKLSHHMVGAYSDLCGSDRLSEISSTTCDEERISDDLCGVQGKLSEWRVGWKRLLHRLHSFLVDCSKHKMQQHKGLARDIIRVTITHNHGTAAPLRAKPVSL